MNPILFFLLAAAVLLVLSLAGYAWILWRKVWRRQARQRIRERLRRERLAGDLHILCASLLDRQVPLIEGAIRIKVLLDNYDAALSRAPQCAVFHQLYEATEHIPTHAAWKALDRQERRTHEKHFAALETKHEDDAREAAQWLRETIPAGSEHAAK